MMLGPCPCLDGASIASNSGAVSEPRGVDQDERVGHPEALLVVKSVGGDETGHRLGQGPEGKRRSACTSLRSISVDQYYFWVKSSRSTVQF